MKKTVKLQGCRFAGTHGEDVSYKVTDQILDRDEDEGGYWSI